MKLNDLVKMNLQYFAEDDTAGENDQSEEAQGHEKGTGQDDEKKVTVAEMQRRIEREQKKHAEEIEAIKASQEEAIQKAVEKAAHEAKLSGEELQEYKEKEAERKHQEEKEALEQENEKLKREIRLAQIRDEATNKLNDLGIAVDENSLALLQAESLDDMAEKADKLAQVINKVKNQDASSKPPRTSGGQASDNEPGDMFSILDSAKQTPVN